MLSYTVHTNMTTNNEIKRIKFHGVEVKNVIIHYLVKKKSDTEIIEEFDAIKSQNCETINIQVVSDYVTITLYNDESLNSIIRRELIPTHAVQHIWINDLIH